MLLDSSVTFLCSASNIEANSWWMILAIRITPILPGIRVVQTSARKSSIGDLKIITGATKKALGFFFPRA
jgi:hypothetical protein